MPKAMSSGMFSDDKGCRCGVLHEGRLIMGGFARYPDQIAASRVNGYDDFEVESADPDINDSENADKAWSRRMTGGQINDIIWMRASAETLVIGTTGGEFVVRGASSTGLLTPLDAAVKAATQRGSALVQPATIDDQLFFVQRSGRTLRRFNYKLASDNFQSEPVSILAEHLSAVGIKEMAYQQDPDSVLWTVLADGRLAGWTIEREQEVNGAHQHVLGGRYQGGHAQAVSICALPGRGTPQQDQLFLAVRRTVAGEDTLRAEVLTNTYRPTFAHDADDDLRRASLLDTVFLDSSVSIGQGQSVLRVEPGVVTPPAYYVQPDYTEDGYFAQFDGSAGPLVFVTAAAHGLEVGQTVILRGFRYVLPVPPFTVSAPPGWEGAAVVIDTVPEPNKFTAVLDGQIVTTPGVGDYEADSGQFYEAYTELTGLDHLEGELVHIQASGSPATPKIVSSGRITLDAPAAPVVVGLPYSSRLETTELAGIGQGQPDDGDKRNSVRVTIWLVNSVGGLVKHGSLGDEYLEEIVTAERYDQMDQAVPPRNHQVRKAITGAWGRNTIVIVQDEPLPLTVAGMWSPTWSNPS